MPEALIWGASGGIGKALVDTLTDNQWRVFAAARNVAYVVADTDGVYRFEAADPNSFRDISSDLAFETRGLDLVVYAAGGLQADLIRKMDVNGWADVLDSNLNSAFLAATHSIPLLRDGGHMMFMGAYVDHLLLPKMGAYAAAKAALEPLVKILRKEQRKLRFSIVRPGAVDTPFWDNAPFKLPADAKPPQQVAEAILSHYAADVNEDLNL
jgi:3-oxoacyl-[acyl-carrier protein] reductase